MGLIAAILLASSSPCLALTESYWHEPVQQLDPISDVDFVGFNEGWTVGAGQVKATKDGGQDWEQQLSMSETFTAVDFVDSLHGWVVSGGGKIMATSNGGLSWVEQPYEVSGAVWTNLRDVAFTDSLHGWAVGQWANNWSCYPLILRTQSGGATWERVVPGGWGFANNAIDRIRPVDEDRITFNGGGGFSWIRTDDGGVSWPHVVWPKPAGDESKYVDVTDVAFSESNPECGWAVGVYIYRPDGYSGIIMYKTSDAGKTWRVVHSEWSESWSYDPGYHVYKICSPDPKTAWAVGYPVNGSTGANLHVVKTSDGGTNWSSTKIPAWLGDRLFDLAGLSFADADHGMITDHAGATISYGPAEFEPSPVVSGLSQAEGPGVGGNSVTITGTCFTNVKKVMFGDTEALDKRVVSDTEIRAVAPAEAEGSTIHTVQVAVETTAGRSADTVADDYQYKSLSSSRPLVVLISGFDSNSVEGDEWSFVRQQLTAAHWDVYVARTKPGGLEGDDTVIDTLSDDWWESALRLDRQLAPWGIQENIFGRPVILIVHSMGGLIARAYADTDYAWPGISEGLQSRCRPVAIDPVGYAE